MQMTLALKGLKNGISRIKSLHSYIAFYNVYHDYEIVTEMFKCKV